MTLSPSAQLDLALANTANTTSLDHSRYAPKQLVTMTVTEKITGTVKDVLGASEEPRECNPHPYPPSHKPHPTSTAIEAIDPLLTPRSPNVARATREEMSAARLPLAYRDSCAHLAIPLNRCRYKNYYLPWKCVVCYPVGGNGC